jgi:hypothetical protein
MVKVKSAFTLLLMVALLALAACGDDDEVRTVTVETPAEPEQNAQVIGDAILIKTRIPDAKTHSGEVLDGSVIGESAFCPGGKTRGGSAGAEITATFHCPGGRLTVSYSPTQRSDVQGSDWKIVSGTGSYKGLRGGGSMVAKFGSDHKGGETFTGTVNR